MKPMAIAGLVLIALGVAGLALGRISCTTKKKVLDIGPVTASVDEKHTINFPDIAGIVVIIAGAGLLLFSRRAA